MLNKFKLLYYLKPQACGNYVDFEEIIVKFIFGKSVKCTINNMRFNFNNKVSRSTCVN